VNSVDPKW